MANPTQVFKRDSKWKKGVIRNLVTDLFLYGKIHTSEFRAKEIRKHAEKLITKSKKQTLFNRRIIESFLRKKSTKEGITVAKHLFDNISKKYLNRQGGYTRIIKAPCRQGDNTKMAIIELV